MNLNNKNVKVCHLTSAHNSDDPRIFHKECTSLAKKNYEVYLIAHGDCYNKNNVQVVGIGDKPKARFQRMIKATKNVYRKALEIDADIYHIHDPELLRYALKLKRHGKQVIFDSHEDYLLTISEKSWIPKVFRKIAAKIFSIYEKKIIKKIDGAVVCYHWTEDRYKKYNKNTKMILNFPIKDENLKGKSVAEFNRKIAFAGGISEQWCHKEIIQAIKDINDISYELAGNLSGDYAKTLMQLEGWKKVHFYGRLPFQEVREKIYSSASIGMALLDYIAQCKKTVGNLSNTKFFEYMQMGLPLVCTDFVLWKQIIDEEECGICVNPHDINQIRAAIEYLIDHPQIAQKMGENGRNAVNKKYNWSIEEEKLFTLYENIIQ